MGVWLWIDTTDAHCKAGLVEEGNVVSFRKLDGPNRHMEGLAPMVEDLITQAGRPIEGVAVNRGPGSFMGIRIGVAFAGAMAESRGMPMKAFSMFDVLRVAAEEYDRPFPALLVAAPSAHRAYAWGIGADGSESVPMGVYSYDELEQLQGGGRIWTSAPLPASAPLHDWQRIPIHPRHYALAMARAIKTDPAQIRPLYIADFVPSQPKNAR